MKKVFLIGLMGLSIVHGANDALMKQAFPSDGWGSCAKEKGSLSFAAIKQLEDKKINLNSKIAAVETCIKGDNPNFRANLQTACKSAAAIVSPTKDKLCGAGGTKALMDKAFPSGGFGSCAKEKGNIDFKSVEELEKTPEGKALVEAKVTSLLSTCPLAKNPNFNTSLQTACKSAAAIVSPTKDKLCGAGGTQALMAKAFPSGGFGSCAKEKGNIDFTSVEELEKTPEGKTLVEAKVASILKDCPFTKNPNFSTSIKAACQSASSIVSENKEKLCGAALSGAMGALDNKALMAKAFPSGGFGSCAKEKGKIDFKSVEELEKTPEGKALVEAKVDSLMKACPFDKNPNFSASIQVACQSASAITSPSKDKLCGASPVSGNDSEALLKKAFPSSGFGECAEGKGALDFGAMALVETSNPNALTPKIKVITDCAKDPKKNPNFVKALTNACNVSTQDSHAKNEICKLVGVGSDTLTVPSPAPEAPPAQPQQVAVEASAQSMAHTQPAVQSQHVSAPESLDKAALEAVITEMQNKIGGLETEVTGLKTQLEINSKYIKDQVMPYMKSVYDYVVGLNKTVQDLVARVGVR